MCSAYGEAVWKWADEALQLRRLKPCEPNFNTSLKAYKLSVTATN